MDYLQISNHANIYKMEYLRTSARWNIRGQNKMEYLQGGIPADIYKMEYLQSGIPADIYKMEYLQTSKRLQAMCCCKNWQSFFRPFARRSKGIEKRQGSLHCGHLHEEGKQNKLLATIVVGYVSCTPQGRSSPGSSTIVGYVSCTPQGRSLPGSSTIVGYVSCTLQGRSSLGLSTIVGYVSCTPQGRSSPASSTIVGYVS